MIEGLIGGVSGLFNDEDGGWAFAGRWKFWSVAAVCIGVAYASYRLYCSVVGSKKTLSERDVRVGGGLEWEREQADIAESLSGLAAERKALTSTLKGKKVSKKYRIYPDTLEGALGFWESDYFDRRYVCGCARLVSRILVRDDGTLHENIDSWVECILREIESSRSPAYYKEFERGLEMLKSGPIRDLIDGVDFLLPSDSYGTELVRATLGLGDEDPIGVCEVKRALITCLLGDIRQGSYGTCSFTPIAQAIKDDDPQPFIKDLVDILRKGRVLRGDQELYVSRHLDYSFLQRPRRWAEIISPQGQLSVNAEVLFVLIERYGSDASSKLQAGKESLFRFKDRLNFGLSDQELLWHIAWQHCFGPKDKGYDVGLLYQDIDQKTFWNGGYEKFKIAYTEFCELRRLMEANGSLKLLKAWEYCMGGRSQDFIEGSNIVCTREIGDSKVDYRARTFFAQILIAAKAQSSEHLLNSIENVLGGENVVCLWESFDRLFSERVKLSSVGSHYLYRMYDDDLQDWREFEIAECFHVVARKIFLEAGMEVLGGPKGEVSEDNLEKLDLIASRVFGSIGFFKDFLKNYLKPKGCARLLQGDPNFSELEGMYKMVAGGNFDPVVKVMYGGCKREAVEFDGDLSWENLAQVMVVLSRFMRDLKVENTILCASRRHGFRFLTRYQGDGFIEEACMKIASSPGNPHEVADRIMSERLSSGRLLVFADGNCNGKDGQRLYYAFGVSGSQMLKIYMVNEEGEVVKDLAGESYMAGPWKIFAGAENGEYKPS